ncbi:hypothetical protein ACQ4M4_28635 [Leptolyngbya sp. AN02str]|uniref:hypothetical protein n=1 Tax=Leptolyngbya sp. AN02str TaxID=3423363 RepID=UPI003D31B2BB
MGNDNFGVGLKLWLIFFLLFYLLQYDFTLSFFLGVVAGLSGAYLHSLWSMNAMPPSPSETGRDERKRFNLRQRLEAAEQLSAVRSLWGWSNNRRKGRSMKSR